tara:strand:+ start:1283 stop:1594 length:312 start_codon:yes stop_codon:yes gene_type:complete
MSNMKMDTQGMSMPIDPNDPKYRKTFNKEPHKPAVITPRRCHTPQIVKELKILINEVLDEREHKKRMNGAYDDVHPLPPSYFDTEHFKHYVGEEEPPYQDWSQ